MESIESCAIADRDSVSRGKHTGIVLRPEQLETVEWMKKRESSSPPYGGIIADNVGAGKTFAIAGLLKDAPLWPVLILVPKSLIWQWVEVLNAADLEEDVHVMSTASRKGQEDTTKEKLVLATHGSLLNPPEDFLKRSWGRIIVDEAHCAKNPKSITSRNLRSLRAHAKWAITATPVQNCKEDLLAIARVVGIVSEDTKLIRDVFTHRVMAVQKDEEDDGLRTKLIFTTVHVPLEHEMEIDAYEDAKKLLVKAGIDVDKLAADVDEEDDEDHIPMSIDPKSRMAILRCRQAATHPAIYYGSLSDSAEKSSSPDHHRCMELSKLAQKAMDLPASEVSSKIAYVIKDVLSHPESASVVFCEWSSEMKILVEALNAAGARAFSFNGKLSVQDREDVLFLFRRSVNKGDDKPSDASKAGRRPSVLVAQIKCASAGLNLQCASRAYIMRPQWNPAVERQAVGRLHRSGQTRDVHVIRLVGKETIDEMVLQRQRGKLKCITEVMKDDDMERVLNN